MTRRGRGAMTPRRNSDVDNGGGERDSSDTLNKRQRLHASSPDLGADSGIGNWFSSPVCEVDSDVAGVDAADRDDSVETPMNIPELLHLIFSFLNQSELSRAQAVCRMWREMGSSEEFWCDLNFENQLISPQHFEIICHRYPNATAVNAYGTPATEELSMKAMSSLRNLEVLTLGKSKFGTMFHRALKGCNTLRSLTIKDATLGTFNGIFIILNDSLHDLQIVGCQFQRLRMRCSQLEVLSLKRSSSMQVATLYCPLLRELDISYCNHLKDADICTAAKSCPLLESLDVSHCPCISNHTLREIAFSCGGLRALSASYCSMIALEDVRLPMLTALKLHCFRGITTASMAALAQICMLEVLEIDDCSSLTSLSLDLPHLQNIRIVHCLKFVELYLSSSLLSSITVSKCPSLQKISIMSHSLKRLRLRNLKSLTVLELQCDCLQEVDLTGCESLTDSICKVFSSRADCPVLRSLVLDSCQSLRTVSFRSTSLVSLSLRDCHAITSIDLNCPYLENASLVGCHSLKSARLSPVGLRSLNLGIHATLNVLHIQAPEMVSLELKGCGALSEAFIDCPLLTSLDASFCSQLKDGCLSAATSSCPLIKSLVMMSCTSVCPDELSSLQCLRNLTYLDLSYTFLVDLKEVFDSCLYLKVLKLQACKYLSDASLKPLYKCNALPALRELDVSYVALCQSAIEELLACCIRLTHISVNGCVNMPLDFCFQMGKQTLTGSYDLQPQDQHDRLLQSLNCIGCPKIKKVVIPHTGSCAHLSLLNLSLSSNLIEVNISCSNLFILNLSNCSSLKILKLDCPKLTSLFLQFTNISEEAVEAVIMQCSMLERLDIRFCSMIFPSSVERLHRACPSLKRIYSKVSSE